MYKERRAVQDHPQQKVIEDINILPKTDEFKNQNSEHINAGHNTRNSNISDVSLSP